MQVTAVSVAAVPQPRPVRRQVLPSGVLGMIVFIFTEVMFFAGMISAFTISRANALPGMWPPPGQPTLPWQSTALNTAALVLSGALLAVAMWRFKKGGAKPFLAASFVLGALFVGLQGREWVALLAEGLTLTSSSMGSFFYLIVGTHGLHALAALIAMGWAFLRLSQGKLTGAQLATVLAFWTFVVGVWPVLYMRVYF